MYLSIFIIIGFDAFLLWNIIISQFQSCGSQPIGMFKSQFLSRYFCTKPLDPCVILPLKVDYIECNVNLLQHVPSSDTDRYHPNFSHLFSSRNLFFVNGLTLKMCMECLRSISFKWYLEYLWHNLLCYGWQLIDLVESEFTGHIWQFM